LLAVPLFQIAFKRFLCMGLSQTGRTIIESHQICGNLQI